MTSLWDNFTGVSGQFADVVVSNVSSYGALELAPLANDTAAQVFEIAADNDLLPLRHSRTSTSSAWDFVRYSPFPAIIFQLCSGYLVKRLKLLSRPTGDVLRLIVYKYLMSLFLFRHIWRANFDSSLYMVGAMSMAFYSIWFVLSVFVSKRLEPARNRAQGLVMIVTQGHMLAFLYPLLADAPHFGDKALACAVMWDLGGNMWVCSALLWGVAAHAESRAIAAKEHLNFDRWVPSEGTDETPDLLKVSTMEPEETLSVQAKSRSYPILDALKAISVQPMLHAAVVGIALNASGIEMPALLDAGIEILGMPIKPGVYFLLGFYAEFNLDRRDKAQFAAVLWARTMLQIAIAALAWALPLKVLYRETICIAVFAPASSVVVQIVAEVGWGDQFMRVSVAAFLASAILGIGMQHFLVDAFAPSGLLSEAVLLQGVGDFE